MGLIRDVQRSRPLQGVIAIVCFVFCYYVFWRSPNAGEESSYTNEELNDLLGGDEKSEVNEFNIKKQELSSLGFQSPLLSSNGLELINYSNRGNTLLSNDKIRLVSDKPHQLGSVFSKETIPSEDSFELELEFNINGHAVKNGMYADGLAIWITDEVLPGGEIFGVANKWNGIGLFIDTYQNNMDKSHRHKGFPYASLQLNNGREGMYDKDSDGVKTEVAGCSLSKVYNVRSGKSKMRLIHLRESGYLSVDFDLRGNGNWKNCFTMENDVNIPLKSYIGFSGATGDLSHNVDLYKLEVHALFDDEGNPIKSIQLINDDLHFHLRQEEEPSTVGDVVPPLERTAVGNRQRRAKNRHDKRRTLTRLHKLEKRLKLKIAEENRQRYNGHDSLISYSWSIVKRLFSWLFALVVLYLVFVVARLYLHRRRVVQANYYRGGIL